MAGLLMVAGMAMMDRHRARKEAKAQKRIFDDMRHAELRRETEERLAQSSSETSTPVSDAVPAWNPSHHNTQRRTSREEDGRSEVNSIRRRKASRRTTWYGGKKEQREERDEREEREERSRWRPKEWRSSIMFKH